MLQPNTSNFMHYDEMRVQMIEVIVGSNEWEVE